MPPCAVKFQKSFPNIECLGSFGENELREIGVKPSENSVYYNFTEKEADVKQLIWLYTEFWCQRYEQGFNCNYPMYQEMLRYNHITPKGEITPSKIKNFIMGHIGETVFDLLLQWMQVPHFYPSPVIDWRKERVKADFFIPSLGKVEIKSCTKEDPKININCSNWNSEYPHITVPVKLLDYIPNVKSRREYGFHITYCEVGGFWTAKEIEEIVNQDEPHWHLDTKDVTHNWNELRDLLSKAKENMGAFDQT